MDNPLHKYLLVSKPPGLACLQTMLHYLLWFERRPNEILKRRGLRAPSLSSRLSDLIALLLISRRIIPSQPLFISYQGVLIEIFMTRARYLLKYIC